MKRVLVLGMLMSLMAMQGCIASTIVLHVAPDGRGRAVITSRLNQSALQAFDAMFGEAPKQGSPEALLPAPMEGALSMQFGTPVKLSSTTIEKVPEGAQRTTIVEFEDVTKLRMGFPPIFAAPAGGFFGMGGLSDWPVISFAMKPHENGDRLLLVR